MRTPALRRISMKSTARRRIGLAKETLLMLNATNVECCPTITTVCASQSLPACVASCRVACTIAESDCPAC
jgi:hypothetical protein